MSFHSKARVNTRLCKEVLSREQPDLSNVKLDRTRGCQSYKINSVLKSCLEFLKFQFGSVVSNLVAIRHMWLDTTDLDCKNTIVIQVNFMNRQGD